MSGFSGEGRDFGDLGTKEMIVSFQEKIGGNG